VVVVVMVVVVFVLVETVEFPVLGDVEVVEEPLESLAEEEEEDDDDYDEEEEGLVSEISFPRSGLPYVDLVFLFFRIHDKLK
jgi:hypothetical protein